MVTDDERRDVARRMRETAEGKFDFCAHNVALEIGMDDPSDFDECFDGEHLEAWRRLADLIEPSEPKVRCVAEVKIDGERLEELVHDAAVKLTGIDRDALLALADEMDAYSGHFSTGLQECTVQAWAVAIRDALGVEHG